MSRGTAVVVGAGPGLGMSIAHRFGREGYDVALISRSARRHAGYLESLAEAGVDAGAHAADVRDGEQIRSALDAVGERYGSIDVVYYGPAAMDTSSFPVPLTEAGADDVREAMSWVYPAVDVVAQVLPGMLERGDGGLLFAGGVSSVVPMPALGSFAVSSAAIRNYAVTLNATLAEHGIYAGTLTIGGGVQRGDIYEHMKTQTDRFGDISAYSLDPDDIAETAWQMYTSRDRAETVFNALPSPADLGHR